MLQSTGRGYGVAFVVALRFAVLGVLALFGIVLVWGHEDGAEFTLQSGFLVIFMVALIVWWWAFARPAASHVAGRGASRNADLGRAAMAGGLIGGLSVFAMWGVWRLAVSEMPDHLPAHLLPAQIVPGLLLPLLVPAAIGLAVLLRWFQLRAAMRRDGAKTVSFARTRRALKWGLIGAQAVAAAFVIIFVFATPNLFAGPDITFTSRAPAGGKTLVITEGCLGIACWHNATLTLNRGRYLRYGESCSLGFSSDGMEFSSGARVTWNKNETALDWASANDLSGRLDLAKDCGRRVKIESPFGTRILWLRQSCALAPCTRKATLWAARAGKTGEMDRYDCQLPSDVFDKLYAARALPAWLSGLAWNNAKDALSWRRSWFGATAVLDLKKACGWNGG